MADIRADDPMNELLGEICVVRLGRRTFSAKLTAINGAELWFQDKAGNYSMMRRGAIESISKMAGKGGAAEVV